jgi:hypothetical protein
MKSSTRLSSDAVQTTDTVSATMAHNEFPANPIRAVGLEAGRITDE